MLFRYKITKSSDYFGSTYLIHYNVIIQKYNHSNSIFNWRTCKDTTLKHITEMLTNYCFSNFDNGLPEIIETIAKYGGTDKMISEYIRRILIRDMRLKDDINNIEKSLDDIVLTNNWETIEIKENE